jgi:hypothetical protein
VASWISVYCRKSVGRITTAQLLDGIRDRDPKAHAGVDYYTLAEDYDVGEPAVRAALVKLAIEDHDPFDDYMVSYGVRRPVFVRRWTNASPHVEEAIERTPPSPALAKRLRASREAIGIELGASQLSDFGIVVAYEVARYLAQKGDGVIADLQHRWTKVVDGGFQDAR